MDEHLLYMQEAIELAKQGLYTAHPNPRVGCLFVKNNRILGQGYHHQTGQAHAEINALQSVTESLVGATCYVTLEPCAHYGRTPPCIDSLIPTGITHLVVATRDPNPLVSGRGIEKAKAAGIEVIEGICEKDAQRLNAGFFKRQLQRLPYVRAKMAMSLDGKTALACGKSQWITSSLARERVQHWRAQSGAIITGIETVLKDNPSLLVRDPILKQCPDTKQPIRIICDSQGRLPKNAQLFHTSYPVWQVVSQGSADSALTTSPAIVKIFSDKKGRVDIVALLHHLAEHQINDVLIESGPTLLGAFLEADCVDEWILHVAPKCLGPEAKPLALFPKAPDLSDVRFQLVSTLQMGDDIELVYKRRRENNV